MNGLYRAMHDALTDIVPDANLLDATTKACETATRHFAQQATRPIGACAATREWKIGIFTTSSTCIYGHDHTGAHRTKNGETW